MNTDAVTQQKNWNGKPYHSLDHMLKQRFGEKVYKGDSERRNVLSQPGW